MSPCCMKETFSHDDIWVRAWQEEKVIAHSDSLIYCPRYTAQFGPFFITTTYSSKTPEQEPVLEGNYFAK
jgi:hypothetical protein